MYTSIRRVAFAAFIFVISFLSLNGASAQSAGSSGSVTGIVTDSTGAVVPESLASLS